MLRELIMFKAYVINLNRPSNGLHQFYQHPDAKYFQLLPAVDTKILELTGDYGLFFNIRQSEQIIHRQVSLGEIAHTLSHINAWRTAVNDPNIVDSEFIVIAEDNVRLVPNFAKYIDTVLRAISGFNNMDILVLQKSPATKTPEEYGHGKFKLLKHTRELFSQVGSSLYLIRKSRARNIIVWLDTYKPCWLAHDFNVFCPEDSLGMLLPSLGFVPANVPALPPPSAPTQKPRRIVQKYQQLNSQTFQF